MSQCSEIRIHPVGTVYLAALCVCVCVCIDYLSSHLIVSTLKLVQKSEQINYERHDDIS